MNNLIAINTVSDICSISLFIKGECKQTIDVQEMHSHTKYLATNFKDILETNNIQIDSLNYIAVCVGPGSYSGIKVGVNFVKGLCMGLNIPVVPINQFDSFNKVISDQEDYYLALFSHRDNIYYQLYNNGSPKSSAICSSYKKLDSNIKIYGYMLDKIKNLHYLPIIPSSENDGALALENYSRLVLNNANKLESIYLTKIE